MLPPLIFATRFRVRRSTMATRLATRSVLQRLYGCRDVASKQRHAAIRVVLSSSSTSSAAAEAAATARANAIAADLTRLPPVLTPPVPQQPHHAEPPQKNVLERLWSRYSLRGQQERIHTAESLFQAASRQASDPRWFGPGRISRDFRPRHALLTMHIWFIHKRLILDIHDKDYALMIQEELFNILWDDTTCRIRQQGVNELMVNKNLLQVQQYTFLHLTHYDHAFSPEFLADPAQRMEELRRLVWYHVMVRDEEAETRFDQLNRLAWYVEAQYQNILMDWPEEYYREARLQWVDLPDFSGLVDAKGELLAENPVPSEDVLPEHWVTNITNRGTEYYWNEETKQTSWDRPV